MIFFCQTAYLYRTGTCCNGSLFLGDFSCSTKQDFRCMPVFACCFGFIPTTWMDGLDLYKHFHNICYFVIWFLIHLKWQSFFLFIYAEVIDLRTWKPLARKSRGSKVLIVGNFYASLLPPPSKIMGWYSGFLFQSDWCKVLNSNGNECSHVEFYWCLTLKWSMGCIYFSTTYASTTYLWTFLMQCTVHDINS